MTAPQTPTGSARLAFHPHRIVASVGVLAVLGSMSLPYVTGQSVERSAIALDALPVLLLLLPVFGLCLVPDHSKPMPGPWAHAAAAVSLVALTYSVVKLLDSFVLAPSLRGTVGPGPWLLVAGSLATTVGVALSVNALHRGSVGRNPGHPDRSDGRKRSRLDENPFGDALFDSLEVDAPFQRKPAEPGDATTADAADVRAPSDLVVEAEPARARRADGPDGTLET